MGERIRLVVSDVDGTLLDPAGEITPRTRAALEEMRQADVTFALATSRRWTGALPVAQQFEGPTPLILCDGALIRDYPSGEIVRTDALEPLSGQAAAEVLAAYELQPIAQYCDAASEYLRAAASIPHPEWTDDYLTRFAAQVRLVPLGQLCDADVSPLRIAAFGPVSVLRRAVVALAGIPAGRQLLLTGSYGMAELTIFSRTASKGSALIHLAERKHLALAETLAIGDGLNDVTMLCAAGLGVAMGHAPRRVRAVADVVTASNVDDGFAQAVEHYVLEAEASFAARHEG